MRRQLLAMASSAALGLAISASGPAGAIQPTPGFGNAADANVIQVRDRGNDGGRGGQGFSGRTGGGGNQNFSGRSGGGNHNFGGRSGGPGISARGNFSQGNFQSGKFEARGHAQSGNFKRRDFSDGKFEARGQVQSGDFQRHKYSRDKDKFEPRGQVQTRQIQRNKFDQSDFNRREARHKDFSRWSGNKPHLVHRGWDRHHKHRFFGVFLIGVPYGYYAVADHPCYDWFYGPQGWGYYWSYDRCPV